MNKKVTPDEAIRVYEYLKKNGVESYYVDPISNIGYDSHYEGKTIVIDAEIPCSIPIVLGSGSSVNLLVAIDNAIKDMNTIHK